jgi:hypothetical protein
VEFGYAILASIVPDLETVPQGLLSGQYVYPVRIVCFNASEMVARRHLRRRRHADPARGRQ